MAKPTYKIIRTVISAENPRHEVLETGLSWADAKKRIRKTGLKAIQEHPAAPVTAE